MTAPNQYQGDVPVELIPGKFWILRYDWAAIGKLKTELGTQFEQEISRASLEMDLPVIARVLVIGLECHHPGEWSVDSIIASSPPVVRIIDAVNKAITVAFYGSREVPESNPPVSPGILRRVVAGMKFWKRGKPRISTA